MKNEAGLHPHCPYCGSKECIEGRFWTFFCPQNKTDNLAKQGLADEIQNKRGIS